MSDLTPDRVNIQTQGVQYTSAVSEYFAQNMGMTMNYINYFQHSEKQFFLNGQYYFAGSVVPQYGVDGLVVFEFKAQIIDVWMFNLVGGASGITTLDLQIGTTSGGSFSSIFTTLPSISYNAHTTPGVYQPVWVGTPNPTLVGTAYSPAAYVPPANTVQPVLNSTVTNAIQPYTAMTLNLVSAQGASAQNCGIIVHYRPYG